MRTALLAALLLVGCRRPHDARPVKVFAAASLTDVLEAFADSFEVRENGEYRVVLNVAGSSLLARQIAFGADADLFVSAHPDWTAYLLEEGRIETVDTLAASNRLVVVTRHVSEDPLAQGRVAVADPEHVPAGLYARDALACSGMWDELVGRLVPTLDVRAALSAVGEGAAESAVVYASDALLAPALVSAEAVPEACRPLVSYTAAVVTPREISSSEAEVNTESAGESRAGDDGAMRFLKLLDEPELAPVWEHYGFEYQSEN